MRHITLISKFPWKHALKAVAASALLLSSASTVWAQNKAYMADCAAPFGQKAAKDPEGTAAICRCMYMRAVRRGQKPTNVGKDRKINDFKMCFDKVLNQRLKSGAKTGRRRNPRNDSTSLVVRDVQDRLGLPKGKIQCVSPARRAGEVFVTYEDEVWRVGRTSAKMRYRHHRRRLDNFSVTSICRQPLGW